jgi:DNA-binding CsgD family transcriptional regulator
MTTVAERDRSEILHRAARARSVRDVFRAAAARLRRLVPHDAAVWFATDPATGLPVAPTRIEGIAHVGEDRCLELWERELRFEDLNLFADLGRAALPAAALRLGTGGHPARSARYRAYVRHAGFVDELRAVLRVDGAPWAAVALMRADGAPPFDRREVEVLGGLSRPLARAVRHHARPPAEGDGARGPGLMLFGAAGELVSMNDDARDWIEELDDDAGGEPVFGLGLPLVIVTTLCQARAIAAARDDRAARVRMRSPATGAWIACHATCLRDEAGRLGVTALVIEDAATSEVAPLVTAAYELSRRELEITCLVARGAGTASIAGALHLSTHTVRAHLKAVFEKVGVSSRGELVARLFADHAWRLHAGG